MGGLYQGVDPLLAEQESSTRATDPTFIVPDRNFPGHGYTGVNLPDTVGDVGPSNYIQTVNASAGTIVEIYDKALPAPTMLAGDPSTFQRMTIPDLPGFPFNPLHGPRGRRPAGHDVAARERHPRRYGVQRQQPLR